MDSYNFHFERMRNVDLQPLSLPVSRLSPAKSSSSIIDHVAHHQHGKGDSAYSSFSGGSTAPDYPSSFLLDDLQPSSFNHFADLRYVKSICHPTPVLQSHSNAMDQLYSSVEAISQQYNRTNIKHQSHAGNRTLHNKAHSVHEVHVRTSSQSAEPSAQPPPVPARLDSFIATKNFENSKVHSGTEYKPLPAQPQQQFRSHNQAHSQSQEAPKTETPGTITGSSGLNSEPVYSVWRGSQQQQKPQTYRLHLQPHDQSRLNQEHNFTTDNKSASEQSRSGNISSRSPSQGKNQSDHVTTKQPSSSGACNGNYRNKLSSHFKSERRRAHSTQDWPSSEQTRAASPWNGMNQNIINSSIQHKGQFYFVTGVYKMAESGPRTHSATVSGFEAAREASAVLETKYQREKERCHSTMDNLFRPFKERSCSLSGTIPDREYALSSQEKDFLKGQEQESLRQPHFKTNSSQCFDTIEETSMTQGPEFGRHTTTNPIFYCGPERNFPPQTNAHLKEVPSINEVHSHNKGDGHAKGRKLHPLGENANEKINKETTPLLYQLTEASRTALKPKNDPGIPPHTMEVVPSEKEQKLVAVNNERAPQEGANKNDRAEAPANTCGTLDDSFKKYYKEKLKDAQCKVLRETSFKRRDLQLSLPRCGCQQTEGRSATIHSFSSSQDSETSTETLTPPSASEETSFVLPHVDIEEETYKVCEKENISADMALPPVARVGRRRRLTSEQKKMCYSEPEKLNQLGSTPNHSTCHSFDNDNDSVFVVKCEGDEQTQCEQGLVATRRRVFETRGRAMSASSTSKTNLKHLQHKALVEYMERKTGQKVAEQPVPQYPSPSRQRHSIGEKPFDLGLRPLSGNRDNRNTKNKSKRPHSAGRVLDSCSSSLRYAQFSVQSCSEHYSGYHNPSRLSPGASWGKSASVESLLDPRKQGVPRNRSISTPHEIQPHDPEEDPVQAHTLEAQRLGSQRNEEELSSVKKVPAGQQPARKVAQRGKSMEELGASKLTKLSELSKSSEHLDKTFSPGEPGRDERSVPHLAETRKVKSLERGRELKLMKEQEISRHKDTQGVAQKQTQKTSAAKSSSELQGEESERSGSNSPRFSQSTCAMENSLSGSQAPKPEELGSTGESDDRFSFPPPPRGRTSSEGDILSISSTPIQTKPPCENTTSSFGRGRTSPVFGSKREQTADDASSELQPAHSKHEVSLSCGVTTDPSLWILPPEQEVREGKQTTILSDESKAAISQQAEEEKNDPGMETELVEDNEELKERGTPEREAEAIRMLKKKTTWEELVNSVVKADQSLARVLCPLSNRKTALMLMEQLLSEDTLLMEEHYKKKQEKKGEAESSYPEEQPEQTPCPVNSDSQDSQQAQADIAEKKRLLVSHIQERLQSVEESRGALQAEVEENAAHGEALKLLVGERCLPVELERFNLFIGDLERVVNLLLCLSARLARVQNALSIVDQYTDAEEKESLDSRHRLLCKQREDAKDLKDNLDRRENLVSTFLSRQLSAEQLQDYRRFVQTKASLLIRQKDLEEKHKLGEEQLEALSNSLNL